MLAMCKKITESDAYCQICNICIPQDQIPSDNSAPLLRALALGNVSIMKADSVETHSERLLQKIKKRIQTIIDI